MKLYLISQSENTGYDTYDSAIVAALNETTAKGIHPSGEQSYWDDNHGWAGWASRPEMVQAKYIGEAAPWIKQGVVLASYNAG